METANKFGPLLVGQGFGPLFVGQGFDHDGHAHSPCTAQPALWYHGKEDAKDAILYSVVGTECRNARSSTKVMSRKDSGLLLVLVGGEAESLWKLERTHICLHRQSLPQQLRMHQLVCLLVRQSQPSQLFNACAEFHDCMIEYDSLRCFLRSSFSQIL